MEYDRKKPLKIWDSSRRVRKGVAVGSFEELVIRGREKLGIPASEPVSFVLDYDGTQIEDGDYLRTLPINSVLLVLRHGEYWRPPRVDVLRAAITAIPRIVCETIQALHLQDEIPTWKIMDNKGRVTVVLHWDQPRGAHPHHMHMHMHRASPSKKHPPYIHTNVDRTRTIITPSGKKETIINDIYPPPPRYSNSPQITIINHDEVQKAAAAFHSAQRMPKQGSPLNSTIHIHTLECAANAHEPAARAASPDNGSVECDFHCCSLHEEGRAIVVQKSVATSPIQDPHLRTSPQPSALSDGKKSGVKQHVRFLDLEEGTTVRPGRDNNDLSESDTDNTNADEDTVTTKKHLLLVDQLTSDRKEHLSIKDIGVILERLSSTIVDVERLNRESEYEGCYNWTIAATIRGVDLSDLGLIYNGYYYVISEHPDYKGGERMAARRHQREDPEDERL